MRVTVTLTGGNSAASVVGSLTSLVLTAFALGSLTTFSAFDLGSLTTFSLTTFCFFKASFAAAFSSSFCFFKASFAAAFSSSFCFFKASFAAAFSSSFCLRSAAFAANFSSSFCFFAVSFAAKLSIFFCSFIADKAYLFSKAISAFVISSTGAGSTTTVSMAGPLLSCSTSFTNSANISCKLWPAFFFAFFFGFVVNKVIASSAEKLYLADNFSMTFIAVLFILLVIKFVFLSFKQICYKIILLKYLNNFISIFLNT